MFLIKFVKTFQEYEYQNKIKIFVIPLDVINAKLYKPIKRLVRLHFGRKKDCLNYISSK